ncbi:phage protease [Paeniglutamicibacter sp. ABSL32-1]|uniref:phage protease n=1 Tax=Paeniglutamicibacter quisquiliarum TaxID=2849498 RepID=UPI001C2D3573|nr:phage protease [Paeniglutamicibacter quisquiliarum]MBV1778688.1 phage protease [Paeniglutamicibacter quisquiliarum]
MSIKAFRTLVKIKADAEGNAPKTIELLKTGSWETPWHGEFEITPQDIQEYIRHFEQGVGLVEGDKQAPINYGHKAADKASGWMPKLYADESGTALLTDPNWTPAAVQAIKDGEWKYISPEFNPRNYPWENPEQEYEFVPNVLTGAALTNIPLFKKLKPVTASRLPSKTVKAAATGDSEHHNEGDHMTLEEIRAKQVADLTAEEKAFLADNKADLTAEELKTFGLEETDDAAAQAAADKEAADKAAADEAAKATADAEAAEAARVAAEGVEASAKPVSITADRLAKLEADAAAGREAQQKLAKAEAAAVVSASVKAGQIKSGDAGKWTDQLLASSGAGRAQLESLLKGLPVNKELDQEIGDAGANVHADAMKEVDTRVKTVRADARKEGKDLSYAEARKQVLAADANLKEQLKEEQ